MSQKVEGGVARATVEQLEFVTPGEVPETVECYISKRMIPGADARLVKYTAGQNQWVHKRFAGEVETKQEEEDLPKHFDFEQEFVEEIVTSDDSEEADEAADEANVEAADEAKVEAADEANVETAG